MTPNFTLEEMVSSDKAKEWEIDNTPTWDILVAIRNTCMGLEKIRALTGHPIKVLSGYRCKELNAVAGGSTHSQHMRGEAADIICPGFGTPMDLARLIADNEETIGFDQLIQEHGRWVHVSFCESPRGSILTNSDIGYTPGLS